MSPTIETKEDLLEQLVDADVLLASDDDRFVLSDSFKSARDANRRALADDEEFDRAASGYTEGTPVDPADVTSVLLATVCALGESLSADVEKGTLLAVAFTLASADYPHPTDGVPPGFVPIRGEDIGLFLALNPSAVIYCWREECVPCDTVSGDFETLLEEGAIPEEVALGAVYGPECQDLLSSEYDVAAAPTTLFCARGRIDSRFVGPRMPTAFAAEIQTITEATVPRT